MASLATIFGSGAMTNSIAEIPGNEVILIIGSNTKESHPVVANMMVRAHRNGAKIIIVDPRDHGLRKFAFSWLRVTPGTDRALLNGFAHVIVREGLQNGRFIAQNTTGFEEWKASLEPFTPEAVERITSVPKDDIVRAARIYGASRKAAIYYTMGVTQHACGTANVNAIANLALLTGNVGRTHTGINPLRGQNNVQGACDAGCLPNVYPGYQRVEIQAVRDKFERAWGRTLSPRPGLTAPEMISGALKCKVRALYIMGENPVLGDANVEHTRKALRALDFLLVQDIFMTETAELADVVLPAACFAEKDGTFTNTERRVQRVRKALQPPGEAREDWRILVDLSKRIGYHTGHESAAEIFQEMGRLWPALEGIRYSRLEAGGLQWPCPTTSHPGTEFLYKGGFPRGKVPFTAVPYEAPRVWTDEHYPFIMNTGRNLFQYHYGSMTRRAEPIEAHAGQAYMEMNPQDAADMGIDEGDRVRVTSVRGSMEVGVRVTRRVRSGEVFVPLHYAESAANLLTDDRQLDEHSSTPGFKVTPVRIEAISKEHDTP